MSATSDQNSTIASHVRRPIACALLWLSCLGLFVTVLAWHLAPYWWFADCVSSWSLHLTLISLIPCAWQLLWRRWQLLRQQRWLLGAHALAALLALWPWLNGPTATDLSKAPNFSAFVVNQGFWNKNPQRWAGLPATCDLVFVSEANLTTLQHIPTAPWAYRAYTVSPWIAFNNALLSRHEMQWSALSDPLHPHIAATIPMPDDGTLLFIGLHLPAPWSQDDVRLRQQALQEVRDLVAEHDGPVIVGGDFNMTPNAKLFKRLCTETGLKPCHRLPRGSWPLWWARFGLAIDHVLVSDDCQADVTYHDMPGSDHQALHVSVYLPAFNDPSAHQGP